MGASDDVERLIAAVRAGGPVLFPTDTVYGLGASALHEPDAVRVYALKGRAGQQPTALIAADLAMLLETVPELEGRAAAIAAALLPGPYTLVLPNPARRLSWLTGLTPEAIGVRVPVLPVETARVLTAVGPLLATSANEPGGASPASLDDVPRRIREGCLALLDIGPLPGSPSTVLDFTSARPRVLREGAAPAAEAIARAEAAVG